MQIRHDRERLASVRLVTERLEMVRLVMAEMGWAGGHASLCSILARLFQLHHHCNHYHQSWYHNHYQHLLLLLFLLQLAKVLVERN